MLECAVMNGLRAAILAMTLVFATVLPSGSAGALPLAVAPEAVRSVGTHPEDGGQLHQARDVSETACPLSSPPEIDVTRFGADGNDNKDDSAAVNDALRCLRRLSEASRAKSGTVYFPPGQYIFDRRVEFAGLGTRVLRGLTLRGAGPQVTVIVSRNNEGLFLLKFNDRRHTVNVSGFRFVPARDNSGTAFEMYQPDGGNQHRRSLVMRDVTVTSDHTDGFFDVAFEVFGGWRTLFDNVMVSGPYGPNVGLDRLYGMRACFILNETYRPALMNSKCWSAQNGLIVDSQKERGEPGPEGLVVSHCNFVEVERGILVRTTGGVEPAAFISNNHINASTVGIDVVNRKFMFITHNLMYLNFRKRRTSERYADIRLNNVHTSIIADNIFHVPARDRDFNGKRDMIVLHGSRNNTVSGNLFNSPGRSVIQLESRGNVIKDNKRLRGAD